MAALALVGSAFAVWQFEASANAEPVDEDYYITKAVDAGSAVINVTGVDADPANKLLILDQPTGDQDTPEAENTVNGVHWHLNSALSFTHTIDNPTTNAAKFKYTLTLTLNGKLGDYVKFSAVASPALPVKSVADKTFVYEWTESAARSEAALTEDVAHAALPAVEYTDSKPANIADYNTMVTNITGDATAKIHIALSVVIADGATDAI
jgi:hypothetical protein